MAPVRMCVRVLYADIEVLAAEMNGYTVRVGRSSKADTEAAVGDSEY